MKNNNSDVTPRVVCGYAVPRGATVAPTRHTVYLVTIRDLDEMEPQC